MSSLASLRRVVPPAIEPLARGLYHNVFRLQLRTRLWWADHFSALPDFPVPPALLRYRVSELIPVSDFLRIGESCAQLMEERANDMGMDFAGGRRVLDFGCGCGRTIGWFLRNCEAEFHGVDVDAAAVDWCKKHLPRGHFLANAPVPPLPYPDEYFDAVYCLSVFTHLNESMQDLWLAELSRILKPGGVLLLTVFGKSANQLLDADGRSELHTRGMVHKRTEKLRGMVPDWYQTTWHSREYIVGRLSASLGEVRYFEVPDGLQDVVAARKPAN
jgi:ubiquinone/menaquinone biosynthesis C-methylase UbiE